jgi:putative sterol carrier protein
MKCEDVFAGMEEKFREFDLKDIFGVFQFHISGPEGGDWYAVCQGDNCRVDQGVVQNPDLRFQASDQTVVRLAEGKLNPAKALLLRKVKVKGNLAMLARLKSMLLGQG